MVHSTSLLSPLLLLLLLLLLLATSSIAKHKDIHGSLVLSLTHSRALPLSSTSLDHEHSQPLDALDMMEPLRGYRDGYLLSLTLGSPQQVVQVYMDTGSDLTWVPCGNFSFDCMDCDGYKNYKLPTSAFSPTYSSSCSRDLCTSRFCADVHSSDNPYDPCATAGCSLGTLVSGLCPRPCPSFSYTYGAGGMVLGSLSRDTLRVHGRTSVAYKDVPSFCFGCVGSSFREPIGIAGFGRGALSLPSQLGFLQKGFSYCLLGFKYANNPNITSPLIVGDLAISSPENFMFTPLTRSPTYPNYYYVGLQGISVGAEAGVVIEAPLSLRSFDSGGNGGMIIDTGTTYTHLPEPFYSLLLSNLSARIAYERSNEHERRTGFDLCYRIPSCADGGSCYYSDNLPSVTLYLSNDAKIALPKESCFYAVSAPKNGSVVKCLLVQSMDDGDYGPAGVFGSFQQQNVAVVYDLENERIGFHPMDCATSAAAYGLLH